jgi:hypothetical protein
MATAVCTERLDTREFLGLRLLGVADAPSSPLAPSWESSMAGTLSQWVAIQGAGGSARCDGGKLTSLGTGDADRGVDRLMGAETRCEVGTWSWGRLRHA